MDCFIRSQLCGCRNAKKICMRVRGWTALKIKQSKKCATDKTRQCGMEEASNEASWSQSRQAEEGEGLIEGETHRGGWREREREGKGSKTCRMYGHPGSSIVSGGTSRCISSKLCRKTQSHAKQHVC